RGEQVIVGVNKFQEEEEKVALEQLKVDPAIEAQQREHLAQIRAERDAARAATALTAIERAAKEATAPMMPLFVEAVKADCTLGEICGVLRQIWGEYQPKVIL
ncbi:MAG TPA: methylmalonyl-CoA mutase, partial [Chloroflexi bacterium]|nr:methylmalonyl-CoA mutase [Chloroflexota bacterium]